jgi:hypothetical protein
MISTPWAILLCKFNDNGSEPHPRKFYEDLFTVSGAGKQNMVDFFTDISHGKLDMSGNQIFPAKEIGWFTVNASFREFRKIVDEENARAEAETEKTRIRLNGKIIREKKVFPNNSVSRRPLVKWAREAAERYHPDWPKVDLSDFYGVLIVFNIPSVDTFGGLNNNAVCDEGSIIPSVLGQEMGHVYGLSHSRSNLTPKDEYTDPWDIMSTLGDAFMEPHPVYGLIGPGLNAANMDGRGWLDKSRMWAPSYGAPGVVDLHPLHRRDLLDGYLGLLIDRYYVEFRMNERWDAHFPSPVVLIHYFEDNISYLVGRWHSDLKKTEGPVLTKKGDTFEIREGESDIFQHIKIKLLDIDVGKQKARISIEYKAIEPFIYHKLPIEFESPAIPLTFLRRAKDIAIVNEKIIRTPQWSLRPILKSLADISSSEQFSSEDIRKTIRREALEKIIEVAHEKLDEMDPFHTGVAPPAPGDLGGHPQDGDGMQ